MIVLGVIVLFAILSLAINAIIGAKHGVGYFDAVFTGMIFTPILPLLICVMAASMAHKPK